MTNTIQSNAAVSGPVPLGPSAVNATRPSPVSTPAPAPQAPRADQATVSTVGSLVSQASEGSDVRYDKVSALQSAISSGTYNVSASAVASKIVDSLTS